MRQALNDYGSVSITQLHHHESGNDECRGHDASPRRLLTENCDADQERAERTDAGPDRIGRAERNRSHREREQADAAKHGADCDDGRPEAREAIGLLHRVSPRNFQKASDTKIDPSHGEPRKKGRAVPTWTLRRGRTWPHNIEIARLAQKSNVRD
jgi:hypothetical protein